MAEGIEQNIRISAIGGGAAAADLNQPMNAMLKIHAAGEQLRSHFSQRFEHVGLHLFGHQLLETIGITGNARPLIVGISTAMELVGNAAGLAVGGLTLLAAAGAAAFAVFRKLNEATQESLKLLEKQYEGHRRVTESLEKYAEAGGHLTEAMKALREQEELALAASIKSITAINAKRLATEEHALEVAKSVAALQAANVATEVYDSALDKSGGSVKDHEEKIVGLRNELEANAKGFATWSEYIKTTTGTLEQAKTQYDSVREAINRMADAAKEAQAIEPAFESAIPDEDPFAKFQMEQADEDMRKYMASVHKAGEEHRKLEQSLGEVGRIGQAVFSTMNAAVGGAFAKMIVESKSWSEAFKGILKQVEEQFISLIVQMAVKWLAFQALTGGVFGAMGAPAANALLGSSFASRATGGDDIVTSPTLFLAGDKGPERATFTPLTQGSPANSMGGGSVTIGAINVHGVNDPRAIAAQVGDAIVQRIRGRGEIDFLRTA